jgi:hypothetical protein
MTERSRDLTDFQEFVSQQLKKIDEFSWTQDIALMM